MLLNTKKIKFKIRNKINCIYNGFNVVFRMPKSKGNFLFKRRFLFIYIFQREEDFTGV